MQAYFKKGSVLAAIGLCPYLVNPFFKVVFNEKVPRQDMHIFNEYVLDKLSVTVAAMKCFFLYSESSRQHWNCNITEMPMVVCLAIIQFLVQFFRNGVDLNDCEMHQ